MTSPKNLRQQSSMSKVKLSDLVVVSTNPGKIAEINSILGTNHKVSKLDIPEIQSLSLDEVITAKAKAAFERIKKPVLVTDISLEIEALGNLPGPFVKFFLMKLGAEKTVALIGPKNTKTKVTDAIAIYDGKNLQIFKGQVFGHLIPKAKGKQGFGFDFVFIPEGSNKTYAQMGTEEKNKISHRFIALKKLKDYLN